MSRASKRTKKEKRQTKKGMELPLYCPKCKTLIPTSIYDKDKNGFDYQCPMCGTFCFEELKKVIEENKDFKLTSSAKKEIEECIHKT